VIPFGGAGATTSTRANEDGFARAVGAAFVGTARLASCCQSVKLERGTFISAQKTFVLKPLFANAAR
jgi:hypothetical protein